MKLYKILSACAISIIFLTTPAFAGISGLGNPILKVTSPTTPANLISIVGCEDFSLIVDDSVGKEYVIQDCASSYTLHQVWPPLASELQGLNKAAVGLGNVDNTTDAGKPVSTAQATALSGKLNVPSGTASQYLDGTGAVKSFASAGTRTWANPSRAIGSCFQISATNDADFHYKVDVASGTLLQATATGTVTVTSYTNSGCTTGARIESDGAPSQSAALGILSIAQIAPVGIDGTLQAGRWLKITTAQTAGTPTFTIRANQTEITLP